MWFIMTSLAAIVTTLVWYVMTPRDKHKVGSLSLILWGATLMWFVDHLMAYWGEGGEFFEINLDATLLGISVIVLALLVWGIALMVNDPNGFLRRALRR